MAIDEPETILELLGKAGQELSQVVGHVNTGERHVWRAFNLATIQGRPTGQIEALLADIRALDQLVGEQVFEIVRKAAEIEAGSEG